jgi:hypothetical protein
VLYSALLVYWKISIDYEAIDKGSLQNPVKKWIPIVSANGFINSNITARYSVLLEKDPLLLQQDVHLRMPTK